MSHDIVDDPTHLAEAHGEERLQRVRLFLAKSNIASLRQVRVGGEGDAVVLSGLVRSYYEKQMAVKFALRVAGVFRVIDLIEVDAYVPLPRRDRGRGLHAHGTASPIFFGN